MSLPRVFERGDEFISEYDRRSPWWNTFSRANCLLAVGFSKLVLNTFYNHKLHGLERIEAALKKSQEENRGLMTVMNHMSVVDDPFLWGFFPWRMYHDVDQIRWGLAAHNVCFTSPALSNFFSLGKILSTQRFGVGPFQGSIDAAVRIMSPDDTLDLVFDYDTFDKKKKDVWVDQTVLVKKVKDDYLPPMIRSKPSWIHVFPEAFVLQLQPPFNNSMRYFKWGITRIILESTRQPIIVPMFGHGFEKIMPEAVADEKSLLDRLLPSNRGSDVHVYIGEPIDEKIIQKYREEWIQLVNWYGDKSGDLTDELKFGKKAEDLRSRLASELRKHVAHIRDTEAGFPPEDPRFKDHKWWKQYTLSEGESDKEVKFIGSNWAIRRLQKFLQEEEKGDK